MDKDLCNIIIGNENLSTPDDTTKWNVDEKKAFIGEVFAELLEIYPLRKIPYTAAGIDYIIATMRTACTHAKCCNIISGSPVDSDGIGHEWFEVVFPDVDTAHADCATASTNIVAYVYILDPPHCPVRTRFVATLNR